MSVEIRYADQSLSYRPDPGRVLFSGGEWQIPEDQRPANWREREQVKHDPPPPKRVQRPSVPGVRTLTKVKAPPKPREPRPPKVKVVRAESEQRARRVWPLVNVTVASILERLRAGRTMNEIGADHGCGITAISQRIHRHGTEAERAELESMRKCGCGHPKYVFEPICYRCRRISKRPLVKQTSGPKPKCLCGACQLCRTRECGRRIRARKAAQR